MDEAVADLDPAVAPLRDLRVVGDQDERHTEFLGHGGDLLHHLVPGGLVECGGGLVGEDHGRRARQRAGDGDALALPAGELAREAVHKGAEAEPGEHVRRLRVGLRAGLTPHDLRQRHVLLRGQLWHELTVLEDEPEVVEAELGTGGMPPAMRDDGLQAALKLRENGPVNVLVLSQYVAPAYARELFSGGDGGTGYLLKDRVAEVKDFVQACETVASGGVVIDPDVAGELLAASSQWLTTLTPREREVLELMAEGLSNAEIAEKLYFSGAAVAKHVSSIFSKLGLTPDEENRRVRAILMYLSERGIT